MTGRYQAVAGRVLEQDLRAVEPSLTLAAAGIDSLVVAELLCALEDEGLPTPPGDLLASITTIGELREWLAVWDERDTAAGGPSRIASADSPCAPSCRSASGETSGPPAPSPTSAP